MDEAEEVLRVIFPAHKYAALPLDPGEEAFYQPPSGVSSESAAVLRRGLAAGLAVRRNHLDAVAAQLLIQWIPVVSTIEMRFFGLASIM